MNRSDSYVWHPFSQMQAFFEENPPSIQSGEGCYITDTDGNTYLDGISSLWCNVHGHRKNELDQAIRDQLDQIAHTTLLGMRNPCVEELARRLAGVTPQGLRWSFFSDSGSSAVEIALKMAFQYWKNQDEPKKTRFLTLGEAYHGDTIGSVSLGGIDLFHRIFSPLLFDSLRVSSPHCKRCPYNKTFLNCDLHCADQLEKLVSEHSESLAAVVVEPLVQGAAGMIVHPEGFLSRARKACDENNVLLICDEVATGFGRTGKMFASEHEDVSPDILCLAKGLTGGYLPLAVTLTSEKLFDAFLGDHHDLKHFFHGHTYTGNALATAAAIANLDVFENEKVMDSVSAKIDLLTSLLEPLSEHPNVFEVRQKGLMVGIEVMKNPDGGEPFDPKLRMGHQVILKARRHGLILRPLGDVVVLMPPLAISNDQIRFLVETTTLSINEAVGELKE